jgi:hypothetical protein
MLQILLVDTLCPSVCPLLVPEPTAFEVQLTIYKVGRYRSPGNAHILADLIQSGGKNICAVFLLVVLGIRKNCINCGGSLNYFVHL